MEVVFLVGSDVRRKCCNRVSDEERSDELVSMMWKCEDDEELRNELNSSRIHRPSFRGLRPPRLTFRSLLQVISVGKDERLYCRQDVADFVVACNGLGGGDCSFGSL